jgi:hypothetical protein
MYFFTFLTHKYLKNSQNVYFDSTFGFNSISFYQNLTVLWFKKQYVTTLGGGGLAICYEAL